MAAVAQNWKALEFAGAICKADFKIVMVAVKQSWKALQHVDKKLWMDASIARAAILQQYSSNPLNRLCDCDSVELKHDLNACWASDPELKKLSQYVTALTKFERYDLDERTFWDDLEYYDDRPRCECCFAWCDDDENDIDPDLVRRRLKMICDYDGIHGWSFADDDMDLVSDCYDCDASGSETSSRWDGDDASWDCDDASLDCMEESDFEGYIQDDIGAFISEVAIKENRSHRRQVSLALNKGAQKSAPTSACFRGCQGL